MNYFIKNIHINKLFHLENFDIPIADAKYPHLIITGKNGSGKTVLLNAIVNYIQFYRQGIVKPSLDDPNFNVKVQFLKSEEDKLLLNREMIVAFYQADRKVKMLEPKSPTKPVLSYGSVKDTVTSQFLNFLSDLKIQEALARNEKQYDDADEINAWFVDFEALLQQIYQDENLKLEFNYKDYSFIICTEGKKFKFTQLSDGFAAVLDIVADLILKMQDDKSLTRTYQKKGIVLIDEIETHLHLELQRIIMPFLTKTFPNIQFIVTTHSPFVLNSMPNAVAFDLEHRKVLDDLTEYSYESLAEGYFGVRTPSSYAEMQLGTLKSLLEKETWTDADKVAIRQLKSEFEKISETASPLIVGSFRQLMIQNSDKLKNL